MELEVKINPKEKVMTLKGVKLKRVDGTHLCKGCYLWVLKEETHPLPCAYVNEEFATIGCAPCFSAGHIYIKVSE